MKLHTLCPSIWKSGLILSLAFGTSVLAAAQKLPDLFRAHETVLFQGDSITDGNRGRNADPNHILGHGYAFIISAEYGAEYANRDLTFVNRGISGNTISDLAARWEVDTIAIKPTVLSILVGINDINAAINQHVELDLKALEAGYDQLLQRAVASQPSIRLILCEPFTLDTGNHREESGIRRKYAEAVSQVVAKLAEKYHAAVAHFQNIFDLAAREAPLTIGFGTVSIPPIPATNSSPRNGFGLITKPFISPLEDPARNSAIAPVVNFERDSYDWLHRHDDVMDEQKKGNPDVVMIGDSITHYWSGLPKASTVNGPKAWDETFGTTKVLNMGFGWDRTQNVLWRLQRGEFVGLTPKSIVLNIGTNNLVGDSTARTNTPEEVAVGIEKIVDELAQRSPASHIYVMGIFPRGFEKNNPLDLQIRRLNGILKTKLTGRPGVTLLDIGDKLREADGSISKTNFSDGTHPTEAGYRIWGKALRDAGVLP